MGSLAGRVAWVTGAASGIGQAVAVALAGQGARVVCLDRDLAGCTATAGMIGQADAIQIDVSVEAEWAAVAKHVRSLGRLDVAVQAAGISLVGNITDMSLADWRRVQAVNLDGVFLGTQAALRLMREFGGSGSIVNVSSASGLRPAPGGSAYSASKAAVCMFSRCAARECLAASEAIRVNTVCPGAVRTPMWRTVPFFQKLIDEHGSEEAAYAAFLGPKGTIAEPAEVAAAVLYLAGDAARLVTGTDLVLDGGYVAGA